MIDYRNLSLAEITVSKAIIITCLFIVCMLPTIWITKNVLVSSLTDAAFWYWVLLLSSGLFFCIATLFMLASIARKDSDGWKIRFIDFCVYERVTTLFGELPQFGKFVWNVVFVTGIFSLFFLIVSVRTDALLGVSTLQLVDLGPVGDMLSTALFALVEETFFVCFLGSTCYAISFRLFRNPLIASLITLFLCPLIFSIYHFGRYGTADISSSFWVFLINFASIAWLLIMRNALFGFSLHMGNNLGKVVSKTFYLPPEVLLIVFGIVIGMEIVLYFVVAKGLNGRMRPVAFS